ncbi:MAG: cytochrome c [Sumerlaeia bacterium]
MKFSKWTKALAVAVMAFGLGSCDGVRETREIIFTGDMHWSPAVKNQEPDSLGISPTGSFNLIPPPGTVAHDAEIYTISNEQADALANKLENPVPLNAETLKLGQKYYNVSCLPCHGQFGMGFGPVVMVQKGMPQPPSLLSEKVMNEWGDGRIYHVITMGQAQMASYAARVSPEHRWMIVHYIRAMQRATQPEGGAQASAPEAESGEQAPAKGG